MKIVAVFSIVTAVMCLVAYGAVAALTTMW